MCNGGDPLGDGALECGLLVSSALDLRDLAPDSLPGWPPGAGSVAARVVLQNY